MIDGKFTGQVGFLFVNHIVWEVWDSKNSKKLMMLCLQNRFGNYWTTRTPYSIGSSKQSSSHTELFWMPRKGMVHMLGRAY